MWTGEHPAHVLDGLFRVWHPFILRFARLVGNKAIVQSPKVSEFNKHEYFFAHVLGRACAEYIVEICANSADINEVRRYVAGARGFEHEPDLLYRATLCV